MKNALKFGVLALIITASLQACTGHSSSSHPDTTEADTSFRNDSANTGTRAGANGSASSVDSGMDKSGSGGTDTTRKP